MMGPFKASLILANSVMLLCAVTSDYRAGLYLASCVVPYAALCPFELTAISIPVGITMHVANTYAALEVRIAPFRSKKGREKQS